MQDALTTSREIVVSWFASRGETIGPSESIAEISARFLVIASRQGFAGDIVSLKEKPEAAYEVRWSYKKASMVGFKQPAPQQSQDAALLVGCAALIENEWCKARL